MKPPNLRKEKIRVKGNAKKNGLILVPHTSKTHPLPPFGLGNPPARINNNPQL